MNANDADLDFEDSNIIWGQPPAGDIKYEDFRDAAKMLGLNITEDQFEQVKPKQEDPKTYRFAFMFSLLAATIALAIAFK